MEMIRKKIEELLAKNEIVTVAIDGQCGAGKTTLAGKLAEIYDCNVFHMDDFFLRPGQRIPERFAEIGGNIDYERFNEAVLTPLRLGKPFSYQPFNCKTFTLANPINVSVKRLNIVEGSYSQHPYFDDPYDLKIVLTVDEQTQRQRIMERPAFLHQRFFETWIPMENRYLEVFEICVKCDILK